MTTPTTEPVDMATVLRTLVSTLTVTDLMVQIDTDPHTEEAHITVRTDAAGEQVTVDWRHVVSWTERLAAAGVTGWQPVTHEDHILTTTWRGWNLSVELRGRP